MVYIHSIKSICFAMRRIASMKFIYLCTYVDFAIIRTFIYFLFLFINESELCICFILFLNSVLFFTMYMFIIIKLKFSINKVTSSTCPLFWRFNIKIVAHGSPAVYIRCHRPISFMIHCVGCNFFN